ncbi:MAG: TonB-dependent receptor [Bacteroidia bacterium]|nr:TonB-dependent receptor [Bacteroidia bacterium]
MSALPGMAQDLRLSGAVSDRSTGSPLQGATVRVLELNKGGYTGADGRYQLALGSAARSRGITLIASYVGYLSDTVRLSPGTAPDLRQDFALEPQEVMAQDVVISASKGLSQSQADVTVSIEVLKPKALEVQALASVDKAISQIPGVDNQDGQINIRGSSGYAYGVGSRVMVMLDGLPLITGDAGTASLDLIPVDNLSQIEVVKGASSVLYGSSALGGVINVITADPGERPRTSIRLRGGVFGMPRNPALDWDGDKSPWSASAHVFHSRRIGKLDLTLQSNFIQESGYRQGAESEEYRNILMLKYRPTQRLILGLNASVSVDSSGQILYWRGYYPDTAIVNGQPVVTGGALTPTLDDGGFRRQLKAEIALDPSIKYITQRGDLLWYRGRLLRNTNRNSTNQESQNYIAYNDFIYQTLLWKRINWVSGATVSLAGVQGDSLYGGSYVFNGDTIESSGSHSGNSVGIYTQLDGKFGPLNTSLGFRYETVQIDDAPREAQPVFRAGLNWKLAEGTNLRASVGQAFRVPSVAERFVNTSGGGVVIDPNPGIGSERGYSAEFGFRQGFQASPGAWQLRGFVDLAAFQMQYEDMVEFGIATRRLAFPRIDIRFSSINIADARIRGAEATTLLEVQRKAFFFNLSGGVTYLDPINLNAVPADSQLDLVNVPTDILNTAKVDQPPVLKYRSRWTVRGTATLGYGPLSLTGNFRYKSFVETIDQYLFIVIPDLADFRARYPSGDPVLDMTLSCDIGRRQNLALVVDNVMNREYLIIPGLLAPQRKATLQYQIRF